MGQDLISKKDLLDFTGISYGQLYRWKRKKLIPEDWFLRKSTFTGQETFFPKEKILTRIEKIKDMKEDLSLDDLADVFSPNLAEVMLKKEELISRGVVTEIAVHIYEEKMGNADSLSFDKILYVYVLDMLLQSGKVSLEEGKILLQTMNDHYKKFEGKQCELIFIRKMGISTFLLALSPNEIYFESHTKVVARMNLASCIEELKIKVGAL